jgi:hypothetical protein
VGQADTGGLSLLLGRSGLGGIAATLLPKLAGLGVRCPQVPQLVECDKVTW